MGKSNAVAVPALMLCASLSACGSPAVASLDAPTDAGPSDAFEPDAPIGPPRSYWRNPAAPECSQRLAPPRWLVTTEAGPPGTVRWVRSLLERDFFQWRMVLGYHVPSYRRIAPSLTGHGVASWIFVAEREDHEHRMIGLNHADGSWGHASPIVDVDFPVMWVPDAYLTVGGRGRRSIVVPRPPDYAPATPPPGTSNVGADFGTDVYPSWHRSALSAWSPRTGDVVTLARGLNGITGVGAGCVEGNRWFTEIPGLYFPSVVNYVRPDGDVIVTSLGHVYVLHGETGEPLRSIDFVDPSTRVATYQPGCGLLIKESDSEWTWLDDDTLTRGPLLRLPEDRVGVTNGWSGTADCGLITAVGDDDVIRFDADGSMRYDITLPPPHGALRAPPVALADGGTLLMTNPPGWTRLSPTGEVLATVRLDTDVVGEVFPAAPTLAPDGTMYFMTSTGSREFRFGAASTGAIPGPYLWPQSGLNWARTNSILPD